MLFAQPTDMKATLFLVIVSVTIGVIYSKSCWDDDDCSSVSCDSSSKRVCSVGVCTCLVAANAGSCSSATCSARADCDSCQCIATHDQQYCYNGFCQCGNRGLMGPGGIGK